MICDKCKKKCTVNWVPGTNYPKYKIEETTGLGEISPINLCYRCSIAFKHWLEAEPETIQDGLKHYEDGSVEP